MTRRQYSYDALMRYARRLGFGEIHTRIDAKTQLHAIIAIHSTKRGPAIGGCRFMEYQSCGDALHDVIRLAYMMTLKASISDLPHGGAKAVIIKPKNMKNVDRAALFRSFGRCIEELNGAYITSLDVGTSKEDMDHAAEVTRHITGHTRPNYNADPSPFTAEGVFRGIQAAVKHKLNRELDGVRVAVQGTGHVASALIERLVKQGAVVTATDINKESLQRCVDDYAVQTVAPDDIYDVDCDVFAPCALGGVINADTLERLKPSIIAGCANNQLAHDRYAHILQKRGVLYAPDFVINAGGLICASSTYLDDNVRQTPKQVDKLYDTLLELFERAEHEQLPTTTVAERIAIEKIPT